MRIYLACLTIFCSGIIGTAQSQPIPIFDILLQFEAPDETVWHFYDHIYNPQQKYGRVVYKRQSIYDETGAPIIPAFEVSYHRLSDSTDVVTYSASRRLQYGPHTVLKVLMPDDLSEHGFGYDLEMDHKGRVHRAYILHMVIGTIAFEVIGNSTVSTFPQISEEILTSLKTFTYTSLPEKVPEEELIKQGHALYKQGNAFYSLALYNLALQQNDRYADAHYYKGLVHGRMNLFDEALQDFDQAISINPSDSYAYGDRAVIYSRTEQFELAIQDYEKAISLNPEHPGHYYNLGLCYSELEDIERAIENISKAIELKPDNLMYINQRAMVYIAKDDNEAGLKDLKKIFEITDQNKELLEYPDVKRILTTAHYMAGYVYKASGDKEQAIIHLKQASESGMGAAQELLDELESEANDL